MRGKGRRRTLSLIFAIFILVSCDSIQRVEDENTPTSQDTKVIILDQEIPKTIKTPNDNASETVQEVFKYNDYNLTLDINPLTRSVTGVEKVSYINRTGIAIEKIYFNLSLNAFSEKVRHKPYFEEFNEKIFEDGKKTYGHINIIDASVDNETMKFNVDETVLVINLSKALQPEDSMEIILQFEAQIPKINHRTGANDAAIWFGNFIPTLGVYDSTGWHTEPYYPAGNPFYTNIANYTVKVITPVGYTVIGTGEEVFVETETSRQTTLTAKMVRDFAFAISDKLDVQTVQTNSGIYVNVYSYSDLKSINEVLVTALKGLDHYGENLGTYPYASLDIVETGLFMEMGIEYSQIIFMDSEFLKTGNFAEELTHQIGRQWFYNIIGSNQIKDAWLSEGLTALLYQGMYYDGEEITEKMQEEYEFIQKNLKKMENKTLLQDLSVYTSWEEYYNVENIRAKLMMYSLYNKMGSSKFSEFISTYYTRYSFKISTKKDFIATAEEIYGSSLSSFFEGWMENFELPPIK